MVEFPLSPLDLYSLKDSIKRGRNALLLWPDRHRPTPIHCYSREKPTPDQVEVHYGSQLAFLGKLLLVVGSVNWARLVCAVSCSRMKNEGHREWTSEGERELKHRALMHTNMEIIIHRYTCDVNKRSHIANERKQEVLVHLLHIHALQSRVLYLLGASPRSDISSSIRVSLRAHLKALVCFMPEAPRFWRE